MIGDLTAQRAQGGKVLRIPPPTVAGRGIRSSGCCAFQGAVFAQSEQ